MDSEPIGFCVLKTERTDPSRIITTILQQQNGAEGSYIIASDTLFFDVCRSNRCRSSIILDTDSYFPLSKLAVVMSIVVPGRTHETAPYSTSNTNCTAFLPVTTCDILQNRSKQCQRRTTTPERNQKRPSLDPALTISGGGLGRSHELRIQIRILGRETSGWPPA